MFWLLYSGEKISSCVSVVSRRLVTVSQLRTFLLAWLAHISVHTLVIHFIY